MALDKIKVQIIKHYQCISLRGAYVTAEMVRNAYQWVGSEYETLLKAFDKDCANFLKRVGKDRSIGTFGAERVRNAVLERLYLRKEKTSIFFSLNVTDIAKSKYLS